MDPPIRYGTPQARLVLSATILASGMAFLDGTVVNVALPRIQDDLGGGLPTVQWVLDGYLLTLGALVLVGGALGDLLGRRTVFLVGIVSFGVTSVLCAAAPNATTLIAARCLQGVAAALMVPASLAILSSVFAGADRGRAIGLWSGLSGITTAVGPVVGGAMVDLGPAGWRGIFLINVPLAVAAAVLTRRGIPAIAGTRTAAPLLQQVDFLGGLLAVLGLALVVGSLIEAPRLGTRAALVGGLLGAAVLVGFVLLEQHRARTAAPPPMMPPALFAIRTFAVANAQTLVVYAALSALLLLFTVALQVGLGWSALAAGAAGVPITLVLAAGSSRAGGMVPRIGARPLLAAGPALMALGIVLLATIRPGASYPVAILPGLLLFAVGLTLVVAPITTTALGEVPGPLAGVGSGVNNAVARVAGLIAIAAIPLAAGLDVDAPTAELFAAYTRAALICAALCGLGGLLALVGYPPGAGRVVAPGEAGPTRAEG